MRIVVACVAFLLTLAVAAPAAFVAVMLLAGPHGGILPRSMQTAALVLGWLVVAILPILVSRWAWRRLAPPRT